MSKRITIRDYSIDLNTVKQLEERGYIVTMAIIATNRYVQHVQAVNKVEQAVSQWYDCIPNELFEQLDNVVSINKRSK